MVLEEQLVQVGRVERVLRRGGTETRRHGDTEVVRGQREARAAVDGVARYHGGESGVDVHVRRAGVVVHGSSPMNSRSR